MALRGMSWILGLALLAGVFPVAAQTAYSVRSDGGSGASNFDDYMYRIDLATGDATRLGPTFYEDVESLAFEPGCRRLFAVDDVTDQLLTCDLETGACSPVGSLGVDVTDTGLAFGPDGRLYMSTDSPKDPTNLYRLDPATGAATLVGDQGQEITGLAANRKVLYGLGGDRRNNLVVLYLSTGESAVVGALKGVALSDGGLDFTAGGVLYGINDVSGRTGPSQIFRIDHYTGAATVVATVHDGETRINGFEGLAIAGGICSAVPLPQHILEVPTAGAWGLGVLAALLMAAGVLFLKR